MPVLSNEQIIDMLSDVIKALDYDLWKEYFVYEDLEDTTVKEMTGIVKEHLNKNTENESSKHI